MGLPCPQTDYYPCHQQTSTKDKNLPVLSIIITILLKIIIPTLGLSEHLWNGRPPQTTTSCQIRSFLTKNVSLPSLSKSQAPPVKLFHSWPRLSSQSSASLSQSLSIDMSFLTKTIITIIVITITINRHVPATELSNCWPITYHRHHHHHHRHVHEIKR